MKRPSAVALVALSTLFAACEKAEIANYQVPKEKTLQVAAAIAPARTPAAAPAPATAPAPAPAVTAPAAPDASPMANTAVPTASGSALAWTAPANWKAQPTGQMRRGSYLVTDERNNEADMSITAFPGDVGGELANVNRWRGQIGLEPISAAELSGALTRIEKNGLKFAVMDAAATGEGAKRTLGAMVPFNGNTWFFKMTGPTNLVAKEKPAFMAFLETVKPSAQ